MTYKGPGTREWDEAVQSRIELMPVYDDLDPRVRAALKETYCDPSDHLQLALMDPEDAIRLIQQWHREDRASCKYAY